MIFLLDFGTVATLWYFLFFYWILELLRQCGIFCFPLNYELFAIPADIFIMTMGYGNEYSSIYIYIYISIRLKIKPNSVRIRF